MQNPSYGENGAVTGRRVPGPIQEPRAPEILPIIQLLAKEASWELKRGLYLLRDSG